jgi:uncharacterized protein (DUF697 family)
MRQSRQGLTTVDLSVDEAGVMALESTVLTVPAEEEDKNWLEKVLSSLLSYKEDGEAFESTEGMIDDAARRAFKISTALGLVPGPLGMATILPEVAALTRLQINLIYRIGKHYGKQEKVNKELVLLILGNAMGIAAGEALLRKAGTTLVVRSVNTGIIRALARKIGARMVDSALEKAVARWIPMVSAPLFGYFSRSLTKKIGREAVRLFSHEVEIEAATGLAR